MTTGWTFDLKLSQKPLVLAGPILRKVSKFSSLLQTSNSVTVWFALQKAATVTLTVYDDKGPILTGVNQTCTIGANLHIVAVTANQLVQGRGDNLTEAVIYSYDATFQVGAATPLSLAEATTAPGAGQTPADLSYIDTGRPSFCLPPSDINNLRLIHGSCRHANGVDGKDGLAILDGLIGETAKDPVLRPHQLFMTGDQIYADDVAEAHLMMLSAAAKQLLGWEEVLPIPAELGGRRTGLQTLPLSRKHICLNTGFTSDESHNHLLTLGEYICMYLFSWSDVLWSGKNIPDQGEVGNYIGGAAAIDQYLIDLRNDLPNQIKRLWGNSELRDFNHVVENIKNNIKYLHQFRSTIPQVRKALANIPSYMILDDHDVTDDFNMAQSYCEKIYGSQLGGRVVTNGLVAYSLCQHWGNAPEQFMKSRGGPGWTLLDTLASIGELAANANDQGRAASIAYETRARDTLMGLVGVHTAEQMRRPPVGAVGPDRLGVFAAYHDPGNLFFDYTVECEAHQVIVTDTRTWRSFPNGPDAPSELLPPDQILRQVTNAGQPTGRRTLFVVVTTNAPPVPAIRYSERNPSLTTNMSKQFAGDPNPDILESWALPSASFDRLIKAISERLPLVGGVRKGAAIILSGDVHHSFASRLRMQAHARIEDLEAQPVDMVIAQLVSSSFRNQTQRTLDLHTGGYISAPIVPNYMLEPRKRGYAGWIVPKGKTTPVAQGLAIAGQWVGKVQFSLDGPKTVTVVEGRANSKEEFGLPYTEILEPVKWVYTLQYITASKKDIAIKDENGVPNFATRPLPKPLAGDLDGQKSYFRNISKNYDAFITGSAAGRDIVGVTNISEVRIDTNNKAAFQTVRWYNPKQDNNNPVFNDEVFLTTYQMSLATTDSLAATGLLPNVGWKFP